MPNLIRFGGVRTDVGGVWRLVATGMGGGWSLSHHSDHTPKLR